MPIINLQAGRLDVKGPQSPTSVVRWFIVAGVLAYTGLAPTVAVSSAATTIALPAGTVTYQGLTPSLRAGDLTAFLGAGQIVIKGPARPESVPRPDAGVLRFTGYAPNVAVDVPGSALTIPAGVLAFTGQTPDRINLKTLAVPAGSVAVTGQFVAIAFSPFSAGAITWQGLAPSLGSGSPGGAVAIAIPKGTLACSGLAPSLRFDFVQAVPKGTLAYTGRDPNVASPASIIIPSGSLVFTGRAPTGDYVAPLGVGSLVHTGRTPTVDVAVAEPGVPAGSVVWQGYAVEIIHSNGDILTSTVSIRRSLTQTGTITRTITRTVRR